ncbi:YdiU family protein [Sphingomonas sp. HDW15A]|uniref:protein adenylyltransferase SelO family protein n=1 Tax=Sphingomonas sp. HDW15A TaxID=2714942 RepID=UPI00140D876D|nr:YdiU family protein [Sphingomonas sp. HDW15A]QIK95457.1 YdiU family protein [Sphingomonas sp. HDW15A]
MSIYRADPAILKLGDRFYDPVRPAQFPVAIARFVNRRAAQGVGLNLDSEGWERHFHRFEPLPGNLEQPLALRYHGHQFRNYNPEIGDGRGFLFAQLRDERGRLLDLGTKGSGQTPYSRFGDGRLTLKGGIREVLATEMLEALGVNTSKTFALFETGESLQRNDEPSPTRSAVLTRLSHGHIRIGTFQRLAFYDDREGLHALADYCHRFLFDQPGAGAERLFEIVLSGTAGLAASYLVAGFVHGVLNSDNINITGESFDYGPWRFTPHWDESFVAAYFDHAGLYAFGVQPEAIHWNLAQLAGCLSLIADREPMEQALNGWPGLFQDALVEALIKRLGLRPADKESDLNLAGAMLAALRTRTATIDRFFFDWRGGRIPEGEVYQAFPFPSLARQLEGRAALPGAIDHPYWSDPEPCSMHIDEVEAIWSAIAERDDWSPFEAKIMAIRRMADAMTPPCA